MLIKIIGTNARRAAALRALEEFIFGIRFHFY